jgi:hypothetical protein
MQGKNTKTMIGLPVKWIVLQCHDENEAFKKHTEIITKSILNPHESR